MAKNKRLTTKQKKSYRQHVFKLTADFQKTLPPERLIKYHEMMFQEWLIKVEAVEIPSIEEWTKEQSKMRL